MTPLNRNRCLESIDACKANALIEHRFGIGMLITPEKRPCRPKDSPFALNRRVSNRGSQRFARYAAKVRVGAGPGSHGSGIKGAIRTILSDPQRPHRCRAEDETIVQFSQ